MVWARLDDGAGGNRKLLALSDAAWRMWGCALIHCQKELTDGFVDGFAIDTFGVKAKNKKAVVDELCAVLIEGKGPLWYRVKGGYQIHDYLDWNDSREDVEKARATSLQRKTLFHNPHLRYTVKSRDGGLCRYCGIAVDWSNRKGANGGTYDHVAPYGGNDPDNLVVACRGCNSRKKGRTPEQAGMPLLPVKSKSDLDVDLDTVAENLDGNKRSTIHSPQESSTNQNSPSAPTRRLLTLFDELHVNRFGAKAGINGAKDAKRMADLWRRRQDDPVTVEALIAVFFESNDPFVLTAGFSIGVFVSQVPKLIAIAAKRLEPVREHWRDECIREHGNTCDGEPEHWLLIQKAKKAS